MPFDFGFNFRNTSSFVIDQNFCAPVLGEAFPHTYTNGNGLTINGGVSAGTVVHNDNSSTNDPRIAGAMFANPSVEATFEIDLSSGSAPGAGTYTLDAAFGDAASSRQVAFDVRDTSTVLITFPKTFTFGGHFVDATKTDVTASSTWNGTTVQKTFATTVCNVVLDPGAVSADFYPVAHFRMTLQAAAATASSPKMLMLLGVGM